MLFAWMLLLAGAALAGIFYLIVSSIPKEQTVKEGDLLAPEAEESKLREADSAGRQALESFILERRGKDGRPEVEIQSIASAKVMVAEMLSAKRGDGTDAPFDPGTCHDIADGAPVLKCAYALRATIKSGKTNPPNLAWLIVRVYKSEAAMKEAYEQMRATCAQTKALSKLFVGGRYTLFQYVANMTGPVWYALEGGAFTKYQGRFDDILPPPKVVTKWSRIK